MGATARGREMICIVSVLVGLSVIAVVMRVFARIKRRVPFGMDDYLCLISMVLMLAMLVELILWCTIGGDGAHVDDLDATALVNFKKIFLANQFTYFVLCPCIKISIICFYRRLFATRTFQWSTLGLNTLITLWGIGIFLACALQCRPLKAYWDTSIDGHCFNSNVFFIVNQAFNVLMDFIILALPIPMIWHLQRAWQDKLALNGVFALGAFVCFASIYRIVVLFWISDSDPTYTVYQATLWTHIEPSIGLICSCLPIIRGLFPKVKLTSNRKYATAPYYINTDVSTSHFVVSSPKSPPTEYFKMQDDMVSRASEQGSITKPTHLNPMDITVRTEIDIDAASMKSHT